MNLGELLLGLAVLAGAAALALALAGSERDAQVARRAQAGALLASLGVLATSLLALDLRYQYAWDHTAADHAWYYRLAGVWAGEQGTLLLWAAVVAVAAAFVGRAARREPALARLHAPAATALALFAGLLGLFALRLGTFEPTSATLLATQPGGRGLAPVLLTPLMVIHPPIQFVAYGLMAVPAAYALAALLRETHAQAATARAYRWARVAWLVATAGLGLGALWAYYVLSFGGYWAWDPVETGNLLPWLALTAYLHAAKAHLRQGDHPLATPVLAYGAFLLTLFATFATRSGLWVSVHAFTDPTDRFEPDAMLRLLAILDAHPPTRAFLATLGAAMLAGPAALLAARGAPRAAARAVALALFALAGVAALAPATFWAALFEAAARAGSPTLALAGILTTLVGGPVAWVYLAAPDRERPARLDVRTLLGASMALLALCAAVALALMLQGVNGADRAAFDRRAPLLALPLVTLLTLAMGIPALGRRPALVLAGAGLAGAGIGWLLMPDARVLGLALAPLAAALVATLARLAQAMGARAATPRLRAAGLLLGASALLGLLTWSNPPTHALGRAVPASLALGIAGFALSALALLGALAALRAQGRALALAGALAGALAAGGAGTGTMLALAALVLLARERAAFAPLRPLSGAQGVALRETGIQLVHLALVVGLLGYAASTYSQERATFAALAPGDEAAAGDVALALGEPLSTLDAQGRLARVEIPVQVAGEPDARLVFEWDPRASSYEGHLVVQRGFAEDVYLTPLAFHTAHGWHGAGSAAQAPGPAAPVDAVTLTAARLPMMTLVWAGLWVMLLGMALVLAGARLAGEPAAARRVPVAQGGGQQALSRPPP